MAGPQRTLADRGQGRNRCRPPHRRDGRSGPWADAGERESARAAAGQFTSIATSRGHLRGTRGVGASLWRRRS